MNGGGTGMGSVERRGPESYESDCLRLRKLDALEIVSVGVGHDLNNLLQMVWANIALARVRAEDPARSVEFNTALDNAGKGLESILTLVKHFVGFARKPQDGAGVFKLAMLMDRYFLPIFRGSGVAIEKSFPAKLLSVRGAEVDFARLFLLLGVNLRKSMSAGGTIAVEGAEYRNDTGGSGRNDCVAISILVKVRGNSGGKRFESYTAVDLATVKDIVERLGGKLNQGTPFENALRMDISFPGEPEAEAKAPSTPPCPALAGERRR